jgi:hypothetical protein
MLGKSLFSNALRGTQRQNAVTSMTKGVHKPDYDA